MGVEEEDVRFACKFDFEVFLAFFGQTGEHSNGNTLKLLQGMLGPIWFDEMDAKIDVFSKYFLSLRLSLQDKGRELAVPYAHPLCSKGRGLRSCQG
jgi:hypothetical protein